MRHQKEVLYVARRQKLKLPVFVSEERTACRTLAPKAKCQIGEGRHRQRKIGQALSGTTIEDPEVTQGGKKAPCDSDGRRLGPRAPLSTQPRQHLFRADATANKRLLGQDELAAEIAEERLCFGRDPIVDWSHNVNWGFHILQRTH